MPPTFQIVNLTVGTLLLLFPALLVQGLHDFQELPIQLKSTMQEAFVVTWDSVSELSLGLSSRISALVNGAHNASHDEIFDNARSGKIRAPDGWVEVRGMSYEGHSVGLLQAHIELFLCPHDYQARSNAETFPGDESLIAAGCRKAADREFRLVEVRFKSGARSVVVHMPLPFTGAREQILAALPAQTPLPKVNRALDFIKSVTFAFLDAAVVPDDELVLEWFGGDEELHESFQTLCAETMLDPAGVTEATKEQSPFTASPTYAHKLGALILAVSSFQLELCVETGSLYGETAIHLAAACDTVFTIELAPKLAARLRGALPTARSRFRRNVILLEGNSGELLRDARVQADPRPALFWLDGHFSAGVTAHLDPAAHRHFGAPVLEELRAVFARRNDRDVILIDDADSFLHPSPGYPSLQELMGLVCQEAPGWRVQLRDNMIRIHRRRAPPALPNACATFGGYLEDLAWDRGASMCEVGGWDLPERSARDLTTPPDL